MTPLLAQGRWEQVLASAVAGLGLALIAVGGMAFLHKRPPEAVEGEAADPAPQARMSKPVALLLIVAGLGIAATALVWRTSLPL
jgi:hypothetical protein